MDDLISRQAAISHVDDVPYIKEHPNVGLLWKAWIESLPSAQPEKHTKKRTETRACDCISRQAVTDTVRKIILGFFSKDGAMTDTEKTLLRVNKAICNGVRELPSAQQDCTECEDYDTERHSCPKYCDVIRKTLEEAKQERKTGRWIPQKDKWGDYVTTVDGYVCSECNNFDCMEENYCPNCGARMEGKG